jgi:uncharacterized membrane protein YebE (DUF533 family)
MSKSYHIAMVQDKKSGLSTLLKLGAVAGTAYFAYKNLISKDKDKDTETDKDSTDDKSTTDKVVSSVDKVAKEASDFAAKVLKAAKKVVE